MYFNDAKRPEEELHCTVSCLLQRNLIRSFWKYLKKSACRKLPSTVNKLSNQ